MENKMLKKIFFCTFFCFLSLSFVFTQNYYRIKNPSQNIYLYESNDQVLYGTPAESNTGSHWQILPIGDGNVRIRNRASGDYMHIENLQAWVQCGAIHDSWWSARWKLENQGSLINIRNAWQNNNYLHIENQTGYVQQGNINSQWQSAAWLFETVGGTPTPITGKYEAEEAFLTGTATVMTDHSGYSGTGFVANLWAAGPSITFNNIAVETSQYYDITVRYANAMGNTRTLSLYINDKDVQQLSFPTLANWDTWADVKTTVQLKTGNNKIAYLFDQDDTGNVNLDYIIIEETSLKQPDLKPTAVSCSPSNPEDGTPVFFSITVSNEGTSAFSGPLPIDIVIDNKVICKSTQSVTIAAGTSKTVVTDTAWTSATGTWDVTARVDPDNSINELNENNNNLTQSVTVMPQPGPDLILTAISLSPSHIQAGDAVSFTATITNQGRDASPNTAHQVKINIGSTELYGEYIGSIAPHSSLPISINGSWNALNGKTELNGEVNYAKNISESNYTNNTYQTMIFVGHGAAVPYDTYEAEDGHTNGTKIGPGRDMYTAEAECSGRMGVKLAARGEYVEWTAGADYNSIVVRLSIPDAAGGGGINSTLALFINGVKKADIPVSSKHAWLYGTSVAPMGLSQSPGAGPARRVFDDSYLLLNETITAGSTVRLEKDAASQADFYTIDLIDLEMVEPALTVNDLDQPAAYVVVNGFTGQDIQNAVNTAQGGSFKGIFMPAGSYTINTSISLSQGLIVQGAGMWHTKLIVNPAGTNNSYEFNSSGDGAQFRDFYFKGNYVERIDGPGKIWNIVNVSHIVWNNIWAEHVVAPIWASNVDDSVVSNCRFRNTYADGLNFTNNSENNLIINCTTRYTGDDGFAIWSATDINGGKNSGNTIKNCTALLPWRAAGIAIYGGENLVVEDCYIADTLNYPGITISGHNFGVPTAPFAGTTEIRRVTLNRVGGQFWGSQQFGAIWFYSGSSSVDGVSVTDVEIIAPTYSGFLFTSLVTTTSINNPIISNVNVYNAPQYGIWMRDMTYDGQALPYGQATFNTVNFYQTGGPIMHNESPDTFTVNKSGSNNW